MAKEPEASAKVAPPPTVYPPSSSSLVFSDAPTPPSPAPASIEPPAEPDAPDPPDRPARIGPYRVLGRIGRGGSGQVLLGEQEEPVRRRVAIKVVPAAALSPELAARFDVERRALEATAHPNIARILDTGRTLHWTHEKLVAAGAAEIVTCVLLDKPSRRVVPFQADFVGFTIPDRFVVGYGIDYAQRYRELPYIGAMPG